MVSQTAYEPELVGGDFSDVFVVDDGHVVVLIGDVAGKGVRAAGLTETVRSTVRALAADRPLAGLHPGQDQRAAAAVRPRRAARHRLPRACSIRTPGHLSYASAGHPAPVHLGAFSCRPLERDLRPAAGLVRATLHRAPTPCSPPRTTWCSTPTASPRRAATASCFGEQRLLEAVAGLRGRSAQEVAEGVRDAALDFAGRLSDDLQVVVLRLA